MSESSNKNGPCLENLESQRSRHFIDKLRDLGLDKHIELPQVAIMGDTSSGKSSVLSALSGITFPSSENLTTRCPTQLVLSYAEEFSGSVTLRRFNSTDLDRKSIETPISSKNEIPIQIQRLTEQLTELISDDCIVIKASGPEFPNLTLIDLPGLVRTVETGEDESMIPRIRALVKRYLNQSRTVILAVVPGNVDIHNVEILQLAEEVDPKGTRTVAIITKLDLIDKGAERAVVELLLNKRKKLTLGYHAVKCRGQQDLNIGISIEVGITKERDFFETSQIWNSKKISPKLLGIGNLRSKLVNLLEFIILRELPNVVKDIDKELTECQDKLVILGEPMDSDSSRRFYYSKVVDSYYELMDAAIRGTYKDRNAPSFFQETNEVEFDNRLRAVIREKDVSFQGNVASKVHTMEYVVTEKFFVGDSIEVKRKKNEDEDGGDSWFGIVQSERSELTLTPNYQEIMVLTEGDSNEILKFNTLDYEVRVKSLNKIKQMIRSNLGDEVPIFPSYNVFRSIVQNYIGSWNAPMTELEEYYQTALSIVSARAIERIQSKDSVKNHLKSKISDILNGLKASVAERLSEKLESGFRPYTLNHYLVDSLIKLRTKPLMDSLKKLGNQGGTVPFDAVMAIMKTHGIGELSNEDHVAIETEYAVIAYLKVATKRFIDEIPILLNDHLLDCFLNLARKLANVTDGVLAELFAEMPKIIEERKELQEKCKSLIAAKKEIVNMGYY